MALAALAVGSAFLAPTLVRGSAALGVVAMAIGVAVGRDGSFTRRLVVAAAGLCVLAVADGGLVDPDDVVTMWRPLAALVAYPVLGRVLMSVVGRYRLFRPTDVIVEAVLVGAAVAIAVQVAIDWWSTTRDLAATPLGPVGSAVPILLVGLDVALIVVIVRSVTASTMRRTPVLVVAVSTALLTIGHLLAAIAITNGAVPGLVVEIVIAAAFTVVGVSSLLAAIVPGPTEVPDEVPLFSSGHAGVVVVAMLAPPTLIGVQFVWGLSVSGAVAAGAALIGLVLAGHVVSLLHERASSEHQATHDALTELPNRLLFTDRLERAIAHAERNGSPVGVLYIDLDRFKDVNDTLGHESGDHVLRQTAKRLTGCARYEDTVARLAGDEFAVLLPHLASADDIMIVADRVLAALGEPVQVGDKTIRNGGSVGVAVYPDDGLTPSDLINAADAAMYRAKDEGGAAIALFSAERHEHAVTRLALETALHEAIENEELVLHYQPIVEGSDGRTCGAESLVRWNHPERGMISPGEFIPVAEKSDLIVKLGEWVIRAACFELARWAQLGCGDRFVTVNVSPRHFRQDLVSSITAALRESGADPTRLVVELTESAAVDDVELVADRLRELRNFGVCAAIDDFGTGYCGLQYLVDLPVSTLKLDRSFVQAMTPS
ncbi:MAG: putative bifunctional diguanylate cyclase/phosphodiesterase, partial [Acidimicrobiales bacterium]